MKIKKCIAMILTCVLVFAQLVSVSAAEDNQSEWYEMVDEQFELDGEYVTSISPYSQYIMDVQTILLKKSSSKFGIRADVYCAAVVKTIHITFYLQKLSNGSWKNVASSTTSVSGVSSTGRSITVSGLSSGTYRAKATAVVTDYVGYSESLTSYTGSLTL
jgi:ABC-type transporter MlaC component